MNNETDNKEIKILYSIQEIAIILQSHAGTVKELIHQRERTGYVIGTPVITTPIKLRKQSPLIAKFRSLINRIKNATTKQNKRDQH
jgi:hypothetical protein